MSEQEQEQEPIGFVNTGNEEPITPFEIARNTLAIAFNGLPDDVEHVLIITLSKSAGIQASACGSKQVIAHAASRTALGLMLEVGAEQALTPRVVAANEAMN